MWGGRYKLGPAEIMEKINASIGFDRRLYAQDIAGSIAHCDMLVAQKILSAKDGRAIKRGLAKVREEIESGRFKFSTKLEDIHFNVEARLTELIGPAGGRLHTARSRNDQIALDVRLWVRDTIDRLEPMLRDLQMALIDRAEEYAATIMPGFTHLQTAQPITFGTCWPMSRWSAATAAAGRRRARLNNAVRPPRWRARPSDRPAQDGGRWASPVRWPIRSMRYPTAIMSWNSSPRPRSRRFTCRASPRRS
jgi:argininosuccinate lyase